MQIYINYLIIFSNFLILIIRLRPFISRLSTPRDGFRRWRREQVTQNVVKVSFFLYVNSPQLSKAVRSANLTFLEREAEYVRNDTSRLFVFDKMAIKNTISDRTWTSSCPSSGCWLRWLCVMRYYILDCAKPLICQNSSFVCFSTLIDKTIDILILFYFKYFRYVTSDR